MELIPTPCEPHIPSKPWRTSCVKGKAQSERHKRIERIVEDSEFPCVQFDYFDLEDTAASDGLKVLSMYVTSFGYCISTVVEIKGATDTFAVAWRVKMLSCLGLSSSEVHPDDHIRATDQWKSIRNSCRGRCAQCWSTSRRT